MEGPDFMFGEFPPPPFGMMPGGPPMMHGKYQRRMPNMFPGPPFMGGPPPPLQGQQGGPIPLLGDIDQAMGPRKRDFDGYQILTLNRNSQSYF